MAFAGEYLKGDASLLISDLTLTDSGEYSCKVKNGAQYHWSTISLIVLGETQTLLSSHEAPGFPKTIKVKSHDLILLLQCAPKD